MSARASIIASLNFSEDVFWQLLVLLTWITTETGNSVSILKQMTALCISH